MTSPFDQTGWVPTRFYWRDGEPTVDWCQFGTNRCTEPFFEQTLARVMRHPATLLFRRSTHADALIGLAHAASASPPDGFIFHLSRCGSTLISQALAACPRHTVLSEAPPVDSVLRAHARDPRADRARRILWLRGLLGAFSRLHRPTAERLFVKFDCWHALELSLIREAFPDTPWIFVYRDPLEILVSQRRLPGTQALPGVLDPRLFGIAPAALPDMTPDDYRARVLAAICGAVTPHVESGRGRLVNYTELPAAIWEGLAVHFRLDLDEDDIGRMHDATRHDAKNPGLPHQADSAEKQHEATSGLRALTEIRVGEVYRRLESLRMGGRGLPAGQATPA